MKCLYKGGILDSKGCVVCERYVRRGLLGSDMIWGVDVCAWYRSIIYMHVSNVSSISSGVRSSSLWQLYAVYGV